MLDACPYLLTSSSPQNSLFFRVQTEPGKAQIQNLIVMPIQPSDIRYNGFIIRITDKAPWGFHYAVFKGEVNGKLQQTLTSKGKLDSRMDAVREAKEYCDNYEEPNNDQSAADDLLDYWNSQY
jgi:hypothetical protein